MIGLCCEQGKGARLRIGIVSTAQALHHQLCLGVSVCDIIRGQCVDGVDGVSAAGPGDSSI